MAQVAQKTKTNAMTQIRTAKLTAALIANRAELMRLEFKTLRDVGEFLLKKSEISEKENFFPDNQQIQNLLSWNGIETADINLKSNGGKRRKNQTVDFELRDAFAGMFRTLTKEQRERADSYFQEKNGTDICDALGIDRESLFPISDEESD